MNIVGRALALSIASILFVLPTATLAASPDAWAAHRSEVASRCIQASGLRSAKLAGEIIDYDDRVGFTAVVVKGTSPQPHMKNIQGRSLCLFSKQTRTAHASTADQIIK